MTMLRDEVPDPGGSGDAHPRFTSGTRLPRRAPSLSPGETARFSVPVATAEPAPGPARLLIVGTGTLAWRLADAVRADRSQRYELVGTCGDAQGELRSSVAAHLGPLVALPHLLESHAIDTAVVALDDGEVPLPLRSLLRARLSGIRIERAAEFYERLTGKIAIESLTPRDVIFASGFPPHRLTGTFARTTSAIVAGLALLAVVPLLAAIAIAVAIDSPGSVFFVQERVGFLGRTFRLIKFRTMRDDAKAPSEWARDNGHRITRLGYWLRRFRLDELPQLVNIVRGEMNLIGPRPHPSANYTLLATVMRNVPETGVEIPFYSLRTLVRPGITGWAQVRYGYANGVVEEVEKLRYDLYYVKHRSTWLDLRILVETIRVVLFSKM